jgi:alanine-glyoxylate transaminase/serine-glyoxylate transaminase/serine-pyruvate transaminase
MAPGPVEELNPPQRTLLGPGPSDVDPRVLRAMSAPILGYLDPEFIKIMDGVAEMLREVFGTADAFTLPVSGTGSAGMEAALANLLEPGDVAMVVENGYFGLRLSEIASRHGAEVVTVPVEWGQTASPEAVEAELKKHPKVKLLAAVHAETSTGVLQPLKALAKLAHDHDALFLADTVTSLGGSPVDFDANDIDFAYSATQKCLGSPPGMAPVAIGARALEAADLVPGPGTALAVLGRWHSRLSSHSSHEHDLRATRVAAIGAARGVGSSVRTTSEERQGSQGRPRSPWSEVAGA